MLTGRSPDKTPLFGATIALAMVAAILSALTWAMAGAQEENDPRTQPIPVLDDPDEGAVVVVRATFTESGATAESVEVAEGRARTQEGAPPLLEVRLRNARGEVYQSFNDWDPRMGAVHEPNGEHGVIILPQAPAEFVFPFSSQLRTMEVVDLRQEPAPVLSVDLTPAIRQFCEPRVDDEECRAALAGIIPPEDTTTIPDDTTTTVPEETTSTVPEEPTSTVPEETTTTVGVTDRDETGSPTSTSRPTQDVPGRQETTTVGTTGSGGQGQGGQVTAERGAGVPSAQANANAPAAAKRDRVALTGADLLGMVAIAAWALALGVLILALSRARGTQRLNR